MSHDARSRHRKSLEENVKTKGEIEAAISKKMSRFQIEYMGRGPKNIHVHLLNDLIVVVFSEVLTAAEQHLAKIHSNSSRDMLKAVRRHLIETAKPDFQKMIRDITFVDVISLHHDISTVTGEEIVIFSLETAPTFRDRD